MYEEKVGFVIKEIRELLGMSQEELCEGICTQSQISKIENGTAEPKARTLYYLSERIGVNIKDLIEMSLSRRLDHNAEVIQKIRSFIREKNYKKVLEMIKVEEKNPNFKKHLNNQQFLLWNKGICTYHLYRDAETSLAFLRNALQLTSRNKKFHNEQEISIMNSIGVIYFETSQYQKAIETYQEALQWINRSPFPHTLSFEKIRILYNYSKALTHLKFFDESVELCREAIHMCIENQTLYLLGELYYQIGYNYYKVGLTSIYLDFFSKAKIFFDFMGKETYINHINQLIEEGPPTKI